MESTSTVVQPGDQRETQTHKTQSPRDQCQWKVRDPELPRRSQSETHAWGGFCNNPMPSVPCWCWRWCWCQSNRLEWMADGKTAVSRLPVADLAAASLPP